MKDVLIKLVFVVVLNLFMQTQAGTLIKFEVENITDNTFYIPLNVYIDIKTELTPEHLSLVKRDDGQSNPVPFQFKNNQLSWIVQGGERSQIFELENTGKPIRFAQLGDSANEGLLVIDFNERNLLGYQFEVMAAPQGVDPAYGRSGFIHPLWSPKGQVLTRVQPEDHYHHYGIWNPWTQLSYDGKKYDLWNLGEKQGTVRFSNFVSRDSGPVYSEFTVIHEHVIFNEDQGEKVIMEELQTIRVYRPTETRHYIMDMTIDLRAKDKPVDLLEYRYGGFGWRATEQWDKNNSEVMSSEGLDRSKVDSTLGRWFYVQGAVDNDYAGAEVMSHPSNFNHPEPMRIWPVAEDNRGDVFASFSPTKNTNWLIEPGKSYVRRYRFVVYNGKLTKQHAESAWQVFANPPTIKMSLM